MSCLPEFSVQKAPEKSSFSQTCSLLSQYLKEKGSFGDLTLGITRGDGNEMPRPTSTMNLFPIVEKPGDISAGNPVRPSTSSLKSMDLFPEQATYGAASSANKAVAKEPEAAQMTIFYGGQVIVFDDFPANKAKELMLLASQVQGSSQNQATPLGPNTSKGQALFAPSHVKTPSDGGNMLPAATNVPNLGIQGTSQPIFCDLPMSRKASLHRFLVKRKDRINAKAPYQTSK